MLQPTFYQMHRHTNSSLNNPLNIVMVQKGSHTQRYQTQTGFPDLEHPSLPSCWQKSKTHQINSSLIPSATSQVESSDLKVSHSDNHTHIS